MRWVEKYNEEGTIKRHDRPPVAYKINKNEVKYILDEIKKNSARKGKELFMPIRLALTGKEHGPELKHVINLLSRDEIITRLKF